MQRGISLLFYLAFFWLLTSLAISLNLFLALWLSSFVNCLFHTPCLFWGGVSSLLVGILPISPCWSKKLQISFPDLSFVSQLGSQCFKLMINWSMVTVTSPLWLTWNTLLLTCLHKEHLLHMSVLRIQGDGACINKFKKNSGCSGHNVSIIGFSWGFMVFSMTA